MKKILLLSTNQAVSPYPVPPLGLGLLYNRLEKNYKVKMVDGLTLSSSDLTTLLHDFQPDYIGLSIRNIDDMVKGATHTFLPGIHETFVEPVKAYNKGVLVLGGSGFTMFPGDLMEYLDGDLGIVGEGESTFLNLLNALEHGGDISAVAGVIQRGSKKISGTTDYLPLTEPFRADLDLRINYKPYRERGAYPVQTKRGCVHRCIYCSYPVLEGRTFRRRSVSDVVDEIEVTAARIADPSLVFELVDSTFNDPPGHGEAICKEIIRRNLRVNLRTMGMNPVNINRNLLNLMRDAGFSQIDATPDSASPAMLKNYGKNFNYDHLIRAAELIRECEMPTMWFFILGGPGETEETLKESFSFVDQYIWRDDMVHITEGLRVYPDTPLASLAIREGLIERDQSLLFPIFYVSPHLGETELTLLVSKMIKDRPNCIRLTETKPPPELMKAALAERKAKKLTEPMFRTLLRLKRQMHHM